MKIETVCRYILLSLVFLAAMNLFAKFFYFVFAAMLLVVILRCKNFIFNDSALLYIGFGIVAAVYNFQNGILAMLRCAAYVMFYLVAYNEVYAVSYGNNDITKKISETEKYGYAMICAVAAGSFFHYFLNYITNLDSSIGRNTEDIWSGEIMSATGQATLACVMVGLAVAMIVAPISKKSRLLGLATIAIILAYNLALAGRTIIVLILAVFAVGFIYFIFTGKIRRKKVRLMLFLLLIFVIVSTAFNTNVGGIKDAWLESNLYDRFFVDANIGITETGRTDSKLNFIINAYKYPLGGLHMREEYGYAHDLLLDGYDEYGMVGLLLLVLMIVNSLIKLYKFCKYTTYGTECKTAVVCVYTAIYLQFFVEPILAGMQWLFVCYCLINGCISAMNKRYYETKKESALHEDTADKHIVRQRQYGKNSLRN